MSAAGGTLTRESICVTCLSQDRKMFPVKDSKLHALLLDLSEGDKLCWECNFFLLKVGSFRSRAVRAQAILNSALNGHIDINEISTLSSLKMGPVTLKDSPVTPDPLQVNVKMEPAETVKEETEYFYECSVEIEEEDAFLPYNGNDDDKVNVTLLPVLNKEGEAKGDDGSGGEAKGDDGSGSEAMGDDLDNASSKSLRRKRTAAKMTKPAKSAKKNKIDKTMPENITEVKGLSLRKVFNETTPIAQECFTVKIMNKEEMLQWRKRKRNIEYYAKHPPALKCEKCIEPFRSVTLYTAHTRRHEQVFGAYECEICGLRSVSDSALGAHAARHYSLLTCKLCAHEWDSPNPMRQHGSAAHGIPVAVWDCDQCQRQFPTARKLARHVILHRVVTCSECGKQVGWNSLKTHMRLHSDDGIPLRTCPVCGGHYRGDHGLAAHMATHDDKVDEEAFCAECNIQFRSKTIYRNHLRYTIKHAHAKPRFKCEYCGKCFPQRAYWKSHMDTVHNDERKHACDVCGQLFKTRNKKRTHERNTHEGARPARNKICDYCGKGFMTKKILQQHLNTHTGARPFACALCSATFGFAAALYLHGRHKHGVNQTRRQRLPAARSSCETVTEDKQEETVTPCS